MVTGQKVPCLRNNENTEKSEEDAKARGIVWTRVYFDYIWAFLMRAPPSTDISVLLLNQPNGLNVKT